ncbi:MAG TPA: hypothetical protein VIR05_01720 [Luteimonas sp.]
MLADEYFGPTGQAQDDANGFAGYGEAIAGVPGGRFHGLRPGWQGAQLLAFKGHRPALFRGLNEDHPVLHCLHPGMGSAPAQLHGLLKVAAYFRC